MTDPFNPPPDVLREHILGKRPKRKNKRVEGNLVAACQTWLKLKGIFAWRNNTGAFKPKEGGFLRYGRVGSGDIFCILPGGRFCSIEAKTAKGVVSPHQKAWAEDVTAAGGLALVVRSVGDLAEGIG